MKPVRPLTVEEKFWRSVSKQASDEGCWLWTGTRDKWGYGMFHDRPHHIIRAHRFAYAIANGVVIDGAHVCHHCDNPRCVRPSHLFLGSHQDNMRDRDEKQHQPTGSRNGRAKLTEAEVKCIRILAADGSFTHQEIADRFMIGKAVITDIVRRKTWRHVA